MVARAAKDLFSQIAANLLSELGDKQQKALRETLASVHSRSCSPNTPRSCDHELDLLEQNTENSAYMLAIT